MATLDELRAFDVNNSSVSLWVFKSRSNGTDAPTYNGRWVDIHQTLRAQLKSIVSEAIERVTEVVEYNILAQNNEASALEIPLDETFGNLIIDASLSETPDKKVCSLKEILNTRFYAIKLIANDKVIFALSVTGSAWKTRKRKDLQNLIFQDERLELDDRTHFEIKKSIDLFIVEGRALMTDKSRSETILSYRQGHEDDLSEMTAEPEFQSAFSNSDPLLEYIGTNRMHLRRASSIRQKGHYKNPVFLQNLQSNYIEYRLSINFDANGKINACLNTAPDILTALLDHRLSSPFSEGIFDVQSSTLVES